jgi:hypothetical protein
MKLYLGIALTLCVLSVGLVAAPVMTALGIKKLQSSKATAPTE